MVARNGVVWACLMALLSSISAGVIGVVLVNGVFGNPVGGFDVLIVPPAVVASAMVGGVVWWGLIERQGSRTYEHAVIVGVLVGVFSHPVMWMLYSVAGPLFLPVGWSEPAVIVMSSLFFTLFSVVFSGIFTVLGGIASALATLRVRRYVEAVRDDTGEAP